MARKHVRAFIGMSAAQAVEVIEHCWERHQTDKDKPPPDRQADLLELGRLATAAHYRYSFDRMFCDIRDVGWCLGHAGGKDLMLKAAEAINSKKLSNGHQYDGFINHCWHGIAGWMA